MIDTVNYFKIISFDIMQFLLKFIYGLIRDITFENVYLFFDVNINFFFSNKKYWKIKPNVRFDVKFTGYVASAINIVSSDLCVCPSQRIKKSLLFYQYTQVNSYQL